MAMVYWTNKENRKADSNKHLSLIAERGVFL